MSITCEFFSSVLKVKETTTKNGINRKKKNLPVIEVGFVTRMDVLNILALMREIKRRSLFIGGFQNETTFVGGDCLTFENTS